jgi:hypothetical protein
VGAVCHRAPDPLDDVVRAVDQVVPRESQHDIAGGHEALVAGAVGLEPVRAVELLPVELDDDLRALDKGSTSPILPCSSWTAALNRQPGPRAPTRRWNCHSSTE